MRQSEPTDRPVGWQEWREGQRRWATLIARFPREHWLDLVRDHYDWLYPKEER